MTPATVPADEAFHDAPWFLALGRLTAGAGWTGHDAARRYMRKHNLRVLTKACVDAVLAAIPQRKRRLVVGALLVTGLWVETPDSGGYELRLHPDAAALDAALQQEEARRAAQRAYERDRKAAQRAKRAQAQGHGADGAQDHGADPAPQQTPTTTSAQDGGADVPVGQPLAVPAGVPEAVPDASLSLSSLSGFEINPEREREISPEPRASVPGAADVPVGQPPVVPAGEEPPASRSPVQAWPADIEQVAGHHRGRFGGQTTPGDRAVVRSRLQEGYSATQLCCAIDGADVDGFYRKIRRTSLSFLLDPKRVDELVARGTPLELREPPASNSPAPPSVAPVASSSVKPGWLEPMPFEKLPPTMPGDSFPGAPREEPLCWSGGVWGYDGGLWHLFGRDPNAKRGAG